MGHFPADCVRVGVALFDTEFDLVIAGVNAGFNISSDHLYSVQLLPQGSSCFRNSWFSIINTLSIALT